MVEYEMAEYEIAAEVICYATNKKLNKSWWISNVHKLALIALETQSAVSFNTRKQSSEIPLNLTLTLMVVNNQRIKEFNKEYRNIGKETDVLSFPNMFVNMAGNNLCTSTNSFPSVFSPGEIELGDIIISFDKIKQQAEEYGHSIEREAAFLFTHGFLHLLGYDHEEENQAKAMFDLQEEILNKAGHKRD